MKVVFLNPSGQLGGAEWCLLDMLASLGAGRRTDCSVSVILSATGPLVQKAAESGVDVTVLPFPRSLSRLGDARLTMTSAGHGKLLLHLLRRSFGIGWGTTRYCFRLRNLLRDIDPDILHTNGLKMHILGAWCRPKGTRVVWHIHDYVTRRPFISRLLRISSRRCTAVIANSNSVAHDVARVAGMQMPIYPVYNAVDLARFSPAGRTLNLDSLAGMTPPANPVVRVGLVATMAPWKGHEVFLRALAMLPRALPVRAYIIGGPIYETDTEQWDLPQLRALANSLDLTDRVGMTGFVEDTAAAMRALDVVVHASTQPEPFGRVIAEAMACAKAVVVSAAGGAAELVIPEIDAVTHAPGDAAGLAHQIRRLSLDPKLRKTLGAAARVTSVRRYDRTRLAVDLHEIYSTVAD